MRYFVTGATGFIGGHLVRQLVDRDDEVVALVRSPDAADSLPSAVEVVQGDVTDKASMREGMSGVDGVFHLAAWYRIGERDPATAERVNVEGTRNVLELMAELDVPKGVYTSTLAVFSDTNGVLVDETYRHEGPHLSVYDRTKWRAHHEVAEPMIDDGLPLVVVMPGAVYGPGDRGPMWMLWRSYLEGELPIVPKRVAYCWSHVEDTATAHLGAMDAGVPGESYIIAGEPYTLEEAFERAEQLTGIDAPRAISPVVFGLLSRLVAPFESFLRLPPEYTAESLRLLAGVTYLGDNAKAKRELGIHHRPFEEGLAETLRAERARLRASDD